MDKSIAKYLDLILKSLDNLEGSRCIWNTLIQKLKINVDLADFLLDNLQSKDYVTVKNISGGRKIISLNPTGKAFINTSSFSTERLQDKRGKQRIKVAFILNIIFGVFGVVFGVWGIFNSFNQNQTINYLESKK